MTAAQPARGPQLTILAEADPLVFVRVLHMIGSLNLIPIRATSELIDDAAIRIELELPRHQLLRYEFFRKRVLTIPTVISLHDGWEARDGREER